MDNVRNFLKKPWAWTLIAGVAGVLVGMIVFGWWMFPVQWTDATPAFLRQDIKADYLRMTLDSYTVNKDAALAKNRWNSLGEDAGKLFDQLQLVTKNISSGDLAAFARIVNTKLSSEVAAAPDATNGEVTTAPQTGGETTLPVVTEPPAKSATSSILPVALGLFCVLTLVLGFIVFYFFLKKGKFPTLRRKQEFVSDAGSAGMPE